jgi:hypothetical protein
VAITDETTALGVGTLFAKPLPVERFGSHFLPTSLAGEAVIENLNKLITSNSKPYDRSHTNMGRLKSIETARRSVAIESHAV